MSRFLSDGGQNNFVFQSKSPPSQHDQIIKILGIASRAKSQQVQLYNIDIRQQGKTMGTDFGRKIKVGPTHVRREANLDIEIEKIARAAIGDLSTLYKFREPDQVKWFLRNNNTLREILSIIYSKIRKEFPSEKITLEVFSDSPRSNEKDIVVSVVTSLPVREAMDSLDKVEDVRWNKDSKDPYVNICVELEYQ